MKAYCTTKLEPAAAINVARRRRAKATTTRWRLCLGVQVCRWRWWRLRTPHSWSTSGQKVDTIATNYIKFSSFLWAFTWYHSWKEWYGSKSYIFKNLMNYFLKLLCLFRKHKHCQVGKIDKFLTINQLKIQITENLKCQQNQSKVPSIQQNSFFIQSWVPSISQNWYLEEELTQLYYFAAKNGWEGWAHLVLP